MPRESAKGLNRKVQREEARAAVLATSEYLFGRRGFEGVALDDIAELSGVRKQNLLYHFQSKEMLWKETVDTLFAGVNAYFWKHRVPDPISWEGLQSFMRTYANICRERPAYVLIPMIEGVGSSWRTTWIAERHFSHHVADFEKYARNLIEAGIVANVEPVFLQNMLTGGVQISLATEPLWSEAIGIQSRAPEFIDQYLDAVLGLVRPRQEKQTPA